MRKPLNMGSFLLERVFQSTPNGVLMAHAEWLPGVQLRHSVPPVQYIYVHIEDCEGWWLSCCFGSVAEHWWLKPGVLGSTPGECQLFHFPLFFAS